MNDINRAIADISNIRARLAVNMQFRGFAPGALIVIAAIAAFVTVAQQIWHEQLAPDNLTQLVIWGGLLLASGAAACIEAIVRSRHQHGGMAAPMLRSALRIVFPFTAAGGIIALAIGAYAPDAIWAVPGIWLLLIALVAFSYMPIMPPGIIWPALWYLLCGTLLLMTAGQTGRLQPWMMGVPLIFGHLLVAFVLFDSRGDDGHA